MKKVNVTLSIEDEKLEALEHYAKKANTGVQKQMDEALKKLYEEIVPQEVREYLDSKSTRSKRAPGNPQPKASAKCGQQTQKKEAVEHGQS